MLTVHHLGHSQSDRVVWLCEELGVPYELKKYDRAPLLSPPEYTALHPIGSAPVITDGSLTLAESAACLEYIIHTYGGGRLAIPPGHADYADYLYWFHFANGTLQPSLGRSMVMKASGVNMSEGIAARQAKKVGSCLRLLDERLGVTKAWLAGKEFSAADVMTVFSLTGMREFFGYDLSDYSNILAYLKRVSEREGYQKAMAKGDPDVDVQALIAGPAPPVFKAMRK